MAGDMGLAYWLGPRAADSAADLLPAQVWPSSAKDSTKHKWSWLFTFKDTKRFFCCSFVEMAEKSVHERQQRSEVWKHFDLVAPKKTKCKTCGSCLAYAASTSTMLHHLRAVHGIDMSGSSTPASKKTGIDAFVVSSPHAAPCSAAKSEQVTDLLVDWCVTDMRPLSIVNDAGLKRIFSLLLPGYTIPSRTHIASLVKKRHKSGRQELSQLFKREAKFVALTTDGWTSKATESYNATTCHFIDCSWELRSCVLETSAFPESHTAENIKKKVHAAAESFQIPDSNVVGVVHDEAASMKAARRTWRNVGKYQNGTSYTRVRLVINERAWFFSVHLDSMQRAKIDVLRKGLFHCGRLQSRGVKQENSAEEPCFNVFTFFDGVIQLFQAQDGLRELRQPGRFRRKTM